MPEIESKQSKGGIARAKSLSQEEKTQIAKKAAAARWGKDTPEAICEGPLQIGGITVNAAVLPGEIRALTQATFLRAIGRARSPKAGTGILSTVDELPFFLSAQALKPFISNELLESTKPLFWIDSDGRKQAGYPADLLPKVRSLLAVQGRSII